MPTPPVVRPSTLDAALRARPELWHGWPATTIYDAERDLERTRRVLIELAEIFCPTVFRAIALQATIYRDERRAALLEQVRGDGAGPLCPAVGSSLRARFEAELAKGPQPIRDLAQALGISRDRVRRLILQTPWGQIRREVSDRAHGQKGGRVSYRYWMVRAESPATSSSTEPSDVLASELVRRGVRSPAALEG